MNKRSRRLLLKWSFLIAGAVFALAVFDWFVLDAMFYLPLVLLQVAVLLAVIWLFLQKPDPVPPPMADRERPETIHYRGTA